MYFLFLYLFNVFVILMYLQKDEERQKKTVLSEKRRAKRERDIVVIRSNKIYNQRNLKKLLIYPTRSIKAKVKRRKRQDHDDDDNDNHKEAEAVFNTKNTK